MARKLVPLEEAAVQLGVSPDELNEMRQRQEIYGYRDGASWKFKPEDVEKLAEERAARAAAGSSGSAAGDEDGDDMVLLSEVELGESGPSTSSTVIGKPGQGQAPADSDIKLATSSSAQPSGQDSDVLPIDLSGDMPLDLGSSMDLASGPGSGSGSDVKLGSSASLESGDVFGGKDSDDESTVQLADSGSGASVLEGSGPGSDITISPGDSGISLVDPADSGLSLEEPLELSTADESSFDLSTSGGSSSGAVGESSDFDSDAVMELKGEDDFLLTPLEEAADEESQDSGSQVIALDSEADFADVAPTVVGTTAPGAMLEADEFAPHIDPLSAAAISAPAGTTTVVMAPTGQAQYSVGWVVGLGACLLVLSLTGMMMFDLARNMWAWESAYPGNSFIMDTLFGV